MGTTISFFQLPGIALLFIVISNNLARYGIMASPPNFKISPGMPTGLTDFFLPITDNRSLIMLILSSSDVASHLHICANCCMVDLTSKMYLERSIIVAMCVCVCVWQHSVQRSMFAVVAWDLSPSLSVRQFGCHGCHSVILT